MDIGPKRTKQTKRTVLNNLFPQTAQPAARKITQDELTVNNPQDTRTQPAWRDPLNQYDNSDEMFEEQEQFTVNQFKNQTESQGPQPIQQSDNTETETIDIRKMARPLVEALPEAPVDGQGRAILKRRPFSKKYTAEEIRELGLDKE